MSISKRHVRGAALTLTLVVALGACGSSDEAGSGASGSGASSSDSTDSNAPGSAKKGDKVDAGVLADTLAKAMARAGSGTSTVQTGSETAKGEFRYVDGKVEQHTTMPVEGQTMEIIAIGDFVYLKGLPGQAKPWVKIDPQATDPVSQMFKNVTGGGMSDPARLAGKLKGTQATVTAAEGDATTYEFTVDSVAVLGAGPAPSPSASTGTGVPVTITYVLDKGGLPTKITTAASGTTVTATYGDWGKKVEFSEPPADQVGPMTFPSSG